MHQFLESFSSIYLIVLKYRFPFYFHIYLTYFPPLYNEVGGLTHNENFNSSPLEKFYSATVIVIHLRMNRSLILY